MAVSDEQIVQLSEFFQTGRFDTQGAVITDLDGTVVHEFNGKTVIHKSVEQALKKLYILGRPIVINTLRFPLSVIRTFGKEWYELAGAPIPVVLLNGSQLGFIKKINEEFVFEQLHSEILTPEEIISVTKSVDRFVNAGILDFVLFYYPENWKNGEIIWTPVPDKIPYLQEKYKSASSVISTNVEKLQSELLQQPVCMIFLLIEIAEDKLMAYQHTRKNNFITHTGINKASGTIKMAELLDFELHDSIGAGDSEMDLFLRETGLSIHVHNTELPYAGKMTTLKVKDFPDLGHLLEKLATMQRISLTT